MLVKVHFKGNQYPDFFDEDDRVVTRYLNADEAAEAADSNYFDSWMM